MAIGNRLPCPEIGNQEVEQPYQMRVQDGPFRLDRVIEKLATSDKVTLTNERVTEGKMRVTSTSWADEKVLAPDQVLEVRFVSGRLQVARKERHHDK